MNEPMSVFGNAMTTSVINAAKKVRNSIVGKYGDDSVSAHHFTVERHPILEELGGRLVIPSAEALDYNELAKPLIISNIGDGSSGLRAALAMCSAARALGYTALWFDLSCYPASGASNRLQHIKEKDFNGNTLAMRSRLFSNFFWEGSHIKNKRSLKQNLKDLYASELLAPFYLDFKTSTPVVALHPFAAQGAVHAGMEHIVTALIGNCPLGTQLAEGTVHTAQTPYAYLGYKMLRGMYNGKQTQCIPENELVYAGHYVDHLMVQHLERDCDKRIARAKSSSALRWVISFDDLTLEKDCLQIILEKLLTLEKEKRAVLLINIGKHKKLWEELKKSIPNLRMWALEYPDDYTSIKNLSDDLRTKKPIEGIHVFSSDDYITNVYNTNLLIRGSDILLTRANELAFYPIPKIITKRSCREEFWNGIHCAELGDGTFECTTAPQICQMIEMLDRDRDAYISMCKCIQKGQSNGMYGGAYEAVRLATE
ncbi:MAG: hypothetical protein RR508_05630 [Oscillospiraceae bacterium]